MLVKAQYQKVQKKKGRKMELMDTSGHGEYMGG